MYGKKSLQYCKVISLQLIKTDKKKRKKKHKEKNLKNKNKNFKHVWWWMLTKLTVVLILQYVQILNHVVQLKGSEFIMFYVNLNKNKWINL